MKQTNLEILAPAGNEECALAALRAGANAVYLGYDRFSARASAENFDAEALKRVTDEAHFYGAKAYVAMNTLVKDGELSDFIHDALLLWGLGVDAIILQEIYLGKAIKERYPEIVLHLSTQAGVCNENGAKLAKEYGFSRVILARETKIEDIRKIAAVLETEVFVQGALCTCFSGQCYFSSFAGGHSGNRGRCKQPCRKKYEYDRVAQKNGTAEKSAKNYALSLSDLCVGEDIAALIDAGVVSFKIEGRMRRKEYVAAATAYYRAVIDGESEQIKSAALSDLKRAYNRGNYTKGLPFGQDKRLLSPFVQGHIGEKVGVIKVVGGKYFVESREKFVKGDAFKILRDKGEVGGAVYSADAPRGFYVVSKERLKNGDGVFVTTDTASSQRALSHCVALPLSLDISLFAEEYGVVTGGGVCVRTAEKLQRAENRALGVQEIKDCFKKTDGLPLEVDFSSVGTDGVFMPKSQLNELRRSFYAALKNARTTLQRKENDPEELLQKVVSLQSNGTQKKEERQSIAVIARSFAVAPQGIDVAILKIDDYASLAENAAQIIRCAFGEAYDNERIRKYVYYPPYCTAKTEDAIACALKACKPLRGVYGENHAAVRFAKENDCCLFLGTGANVSNVIAAAEVAKVQNLDAVALSKEIDCKAQAALAYTLSRLGVAAYSLTTGDVKLMDLCYCPFGKTCSVCDKKDAYTLTDENGRAFPVRRYKDGWGECRFEIYNCASLVGGSPLNALVDLTMTGTQKIKGNIAAFCADETKQKETFKKYTYGHARDGVK